MILSLLLVSFIGLGNNNEPYKKQITCEAWEQRKYGVLFDDKLTRRAKMQLLGFLRSKVIGQCPKFI